MASGKEIRISIQSALNAAGIEATKSQVAAMASSVKKHLGDMATHNRRHWADIKAAWDMGLGAIKKAWAAFSTVMKSAFHFETQTRQFKTLIGSMDEAKRHMADLKELGDTPPFSLDEFAKASRSLMVMTDGALGFKKSLELVGDAAAATGHPVEEMGQAVGRLYAMIRDGQPLSRATVQLRNMGVITPEVAQKLSDLQKEGKSNAEIWAEVEAQLSRYKGAMAETADTGEGLMGAIKSRWNNIIRAFGMAWADEAKGGMQTVLDKLKEIEEDGTLAVWAAKIGEAIHEAVEAVKALHNELNSVGDAKPEDIFDRAHGKSDGVAKFFGNAWAGLGAIGAWGRGLFVPGESAMENYHAYAALHGYGQWADANARELSRKMNENGQWHGDIDIRAAQEQHEAEMKAEYVKKRKEKESAEKKVAAEREAAEEKRIKDQFAEAQKKTDERNAKIAAEKKAEADKKAAEKAAKERERLEAREAARREREITRLHNRRLALLRKEYSERERLASEAQRWEAEAESKLQQAWGWYRDKGSMAAQLQEERENARAEKQFNEDFLRLQKNHKNWRDAENLSIDEEAIRRVALAYEEREEAAEFAAVTADAAERAAKALEFLQKVFENVGGQ